MHREATMSTTEAQPRHPDGSLTADLSRHVVQLFSEYTGRGPTKARTTIRDNLVVCVTQDCMTKAERRLVAEGEADLVDTIRRRFQTAMRADLVAEVERLTGRTVVSFLSDHDARQDFAAEIFILDSPSSAGDAGP
jgi:uncharacterized protein YbcI